ENVRAIERLVEAAEIELIVVDGEGLTGLDTGDTGELPSTERALRDRVVEAQQAVSGTDRQVNAIDGDEALAGVEGRRAAFQIGLERVRRSARFTAGAKVSRTGVDRLADGVR